MNLSGAHDTQSFCLFRSQNVNRETIGDSSQTHSWLGQSLSLCLLTIHLGIWQCLDICLNGFHVPTCLTSSPGRGDPSSVTWHEATKHQDPGLVGHSNCPPVVAYFFQMWCVPSSAIKKTQSTIPWLIFEYIWFIHWRPGALSSSTWVEFSFKGLHCSHWVTRTHANLDKCTCLLGLHEANMHNKVWHVIWKNKLAELAKLSIKKRGANKTCLKHIETAKYSRYWIVKRKFVPSGLYQLYVSIFYQT